MAARDSARPGGGLNAVQTLLLAAAMILPGLAPAYFGWSGGLLAIPVFVLLVLRGAGSGGIVVRNAVLLAGLAALPLKQLASLLFALTFLPVGYGFFRSAARGDSEWRAVARGCLYLGAGWMLFWMVYGAVDGENPYRHLLALIDAGLAQTYEFYRSRTDLPAETMLYLEQAVRETRQLVPLMLPGLLCGSVLVTVMVNLLAGIALVNRLQPGALPWRQFSEWRLPDWLVWPVIGGGALLVIGTEGVATLAISVLLVCGMLYLFQGLAVFMQLLARWQVPLALRMFFYVMLIVQSYGLVLLALLGLADVWFDFRRRNEINT